MPLSDFGSQRRNFLPPNHAKPGHAHLSCVTVNRALIVSILEILILLTSPNNALSFAFSESRRDPHAEPPQEEAVTEGGGTVADSLYHTTVNGKAER